MMSLPFCRHIYKYLLNKKISWEELSFFDLLFMKDWVSWSLGHMSQKWCMFTGLSWEVTLGENEGGGTHSLLSSLSDNSMVADDVLEYVRRYAELRMIK
ncbi:PREDICTED: E3 ubiquitin-protein ligase UBR5-like isoform X1 [Amphimedon queenslandica]|uniref:Uncharacterized protein n=1 Tax=Amphimedon queenslandica TaxID=400682 RepID=A0AAN0JJW1_AMPQE|nr:PREDICTED: E3 ubiquitin-protein ligase UBR5-like isoform X1 [Amphimedon queenslandica]|eukprot:XP_019857057.1 PREDICTED: E3 ubiquitin-protein ligase UBR5-like isoform X1 [Amphimedon queenslandica]